MCATVCTTALWDLDETRVRVQNVRVCVCTDALWDLDETLFAQVLVRLLVVHVPIRILVLLLVEA